MNTYAFEHPYLGDTWAVANYLLRLSARLEEPVGWHRYAGTFDITELAEQCLAELATPPEAEVVLTDEPGEVIDFPQVYLNPYLPTRGRWYPQASGVIAYQFDGKSGAKEKNIPTPELEDLLLAYIEAKGFKPLRVGRPQTVEQIVASLATAEAFIGVESGVSHVAHSVGTPIFLLQNSIPLDHLLTFHTGKSFTLCRDVPDVLQKFGIWHKTRPAAIFKPNNRTANLPKSGCKGCQRKAARQSQIETGAAAPDLLKSPSLKTDEL